MIPRCVRLQGFLSYKEEQVITFDNANLWMLTGMNGSGKSSIFDAVTYALFGRHRGGGQQADELINKDSDGLVVEFEFLLDGKAYRARRTLKRNNRGGVSATQQIWWYRPGANGHGEWLAVEGTKQRREYDAWIAEHLGLNYETFTSSVLLLQGQAEKLLNSGPKDRFAVLAGIVDLERYEQLHRLADDRRKEIESQVKVLRERLQALPEILPLELVEAESRIAAAQCACQQAEDEVERLHQLASLALQWTDLQERLTEVRRRWHEAQRLLADAATIERDLQRWHELRAVLPHIKAVVTPRGQLRASEDKSRELTHHVDKMAKQVRELEQALDRTRRKRDDLHQRIANEETRHRELAVQLRRISVEMEKLKEFELQQRELNRVHHALSRLPGNPEEAVRQARLACDELTVLAQAVFLLERLHRQREELRHACREQQESAQALLEVQVRGKQLAEETEPLKTRLQEASAARQQADQRAARTQALLDQARASLEELNKLEGAKICRACGQELTARHLQQEQHHRRNHLAQAEQQARQANAEQRAALEQEETLGRQLADLERRLQEAREEYRERKARADQASREVTRLQHECNRTYRELPDLFQARVSAATPPEWLKTEYPSAEELTLLSQQAGTLAAARQRLQEAEQNLRAWNDWKAQETSLKQNLARLQTDLSAEPNAVRTEFVRLESEEQALEKSLSERRREKEETQKELDRLDRERDRVRQELTKIEGQLALEEANRRHWRQTQEAALRLLPEDWRQRAERAGISELYNWEGEFAELEKRHTEERGRQLQEARHNLQRLQHDCDELERRQEQFPAEARQGVEQIQTRLRLARQTQRVREEELAQTRQHKAWLERQRQERDQLLQELCELERKLARAKILAELLGRDRLQLHLVRRAERQVLDYANAVLDRLSGGQLYLRLAGEAGSEGTTAKALELEAYNRATGEKPINVAFLSGSQKFRVAVSLALGIGQYASRQHRPIESVIIDEGFGCLDRQGRQVMIQELQNLRGHLRCILLVSHQEEFANAFPNGYRFELNEGATQVTRFQR